eukprot:7621950-Lingulodinium_polyedra.AAC.1
MRTTPLGEGGAQLAGSVGTPPSAWAGSFQCGALGRSCPGPLPLDLPLPVQSRPRWPLPQYQQACLRPLGHEPSVHSPLFQL